MELTPQQRQQVQQAKSAGARRVVVSFTRDQKNSWKAAVEQELASKSENIDRARQVLAAAEQSGFFGDVRRAILLSRIPIEELAQQVGVDPLLLADFQVNEAQLPAQAFDSLIERLGLRLVQEIPR